MDDPDGELVARSLRGDLAAFDELDARHRGKLIGLVSKMLSRANEDTRESKGIVQSAMINARDGLAGFRGKALFYSWLYTIAENEARAWLRKRHQAARTEVSIDVVRSHDGTVDSASIQETSLELASPQTPAEDFELHRHYLSYLRQSRERLDPYLREVFALHAGDLSDEDIEHVLEISPAVHREYKARIRRQLAIVGAEDRSA